MATRASHLLSAAFAATIVAVISGRHLSKHDTDRETYMEEYHLTPDELIAKDFRMIRSSRRGFYPHGKSDWIAAVKKLHKQGRSVFAGDLQDKHPYLSSTKAYGFLAIGTRLCAQRDSIPKGCGCARSGTREKLSMNYSGCKSKLTSLSQLRDEKSPKAIFGSTPPIRGE